MLEAEILKKKCKMWDLKDVIRMSLNHSVHDVADKLKIFVRFFNEDFFFIYLIIFVENSENKNWHNLIYF